MPLGWQDIVVAGLVLVAGLYFGRRLWRLGSADKSPSCGGCEGCGSDPPAAKLVTLDPPAKK